MIVSIATNSVTIEFEGQATPRSAFKITPQIKPQSHTEHFTLLLFVTTGHTSLGLFIIIPSSNLVSKIGHLTKRVIDNG